MELRQFIRATVLVFSLSCAVLAADATPDRTELGIFHPLECLMSGEIEATVYAYNRTDTEQFYTGELSDEAGGLVLSGDWDLQLEHVKDGQVAWSKRIGPEDRPAGERSRLAPHGDRSWKLRIPLRKFVEHQGNYRFRVSQGAHSHAGRLFRVVERRGTPNWISLTYTPDKETYFIGEAISVHFTLKNNGTDEFHFEEGGDYRGASRHLRWVFTAENEKREKAVDPKPSQPCFGGLGMADPHVKPGKTYDKDLPLLAYLRFPGPGRYLVTCFQSMGFGKPVEGLGGSDVGWGPYAFGDRFEIELRLPTDEEAGDLLRATLAMEKHERSQRFSTLYHPCFLRPLGTLLVGETDKGRTEALVAGIGSVVTVDSTRQLVSLAEDERGDVRIAALRQLAWRLPDPRDTGKARHDSPFRFYSPAGRREDVKASWDESLRGRVRGLLLKGLKSSLLDEVSGCAYSLGALGETDTADDLARAADRIAPTIPVAEKNTVCVNQIASAASLLAQLGAEPCAADKSSSPGRLAVWANMVRTKQAYRTGDWEELTLHMLNLDCPVTRMAAIRWLPSDFSLRDRIPWKKLFLEKDTQIWWHAIQIARQTFPPNLREVAQESLDETKDDHKRGDFKSLIDEIDKRSKDE